MFFPIRITTALRFITSPISVRQTIAVSDQRNQDLVSLNKKTGALVWRTEIGEPFLPPTIGDQVVIASTIETEIIPERFRRLTVSM